MFRTDFEIIEIVYANKYKHIIFTEVFSVLEQIFFGILNISGVGRVC